jgi:hypothetical protein
MLAYAAHLEKLLPAAGERKSSVPTPRTHAGSRVDTAMLPIGDGPMLARKRS